MFAGAEVFIYSIFIAEFVNQITERLGNIRISKKRVLSVLTKSTPFIITILIGIMLILSTMPIVQYQSTEGANPALNGSYLVSSNEVYSLASDLKDFQYLRDLPLPNNDSTLQLLISAVPYYNIYSLPPNYQNFASKFPNASVVKSLFDAFQIHNISNVSSILISQKIGLIIVFDPSQGGNITSHGTWISGGGRNFATIVNETHKYEVISKNNDFIVYKVIHLSTSFLYNLNSSGYNIDMVLYNILSVVIPLILILNPTGIYKLKLLNKIRKC